MRRYALLNRSPALGLTEFAEAHKYIFALLCLAALLVVVLGCMFYLIPQTSGGKLFTLALFALGALWITIDMR